MPEFLVCGASAAPLSIRITAVVASTVVRAVRWLLSDLKRGRDIDTVALRNGVEAAFRASDRAGVWNWKAAYDACETATVLSLRHYGAAIRSTSTSAAATLSPPMSAVSLLAVLVELAAVSLKLKELFVSCPGILFQLFLTISARRFDTASNKEGLDASFLPNVVVMSPLSSLAITEREDV